MNDFQVAALIAALIFILGCLALTFKVRLNIAATRLLNKGFVFFSLLMLILVILAPFDIYLRGYRTTKFLIWLYLFSGSFLFVLGNREVIKQPLRFFSGTLFFYPVISAILIFVIPSFLGTLLSISIWLRIIGDPAAIMYEDKEIRIEKLCHNCDGMEGFPNYYKKSGPLEYFEGELYVGYYFDPDSVSISKTEKLVTVYQYKRGFDPVSFRFRR